MLTILGISLGLTLLLEEGFALCWGLRSPRELTVVALANVLTNPVVVLAYYTAAGLWRWPAVPVMLALEGAAVLVEWQCYRACSEQLRRPFLFALLANALSCAVGCLMNMLSAYAVPF